MSVPIVKVPGTTGLGLMNFTWKPTPTKFEDAFKIMLQAIEQGATFWNAGEFYGMNSSELNLELLQAFFAKYPETRSKVVISVKGGLKQMIPDSSRENLIKSVDNIIRFFPGNYIDLFEPARLDGKVPIEEVVSTLAELVKAGKIRGISLSEVNAETLRRAAKVHQISAVEVEFSLVTRNPLENGLLKTAFENNVTVVAYSPLGRGFLSGHLKSLADLPENDIRRHMDRFNTEEYFNHNLKFLERLEPIAAKKGITLAQLALAWVRYFSGKPGFPQVIPIPSVSTSVERLIENVTDVGLTEAEFKEVQEVVDSFEIKGGRANAMMETFMDM
ncbi:unnamed protein product [Kuraishia capsulata CBS 1993]|uniref:NADP-dependent oxidoreductase domain-containing protein n=1 Tax=Kuraishia capsulata CBS 1993 TaxID=1382522 RepID=W6MHT1_9ASCO|nr:uncharacterized protein KUCA_T00001870001 [Kuraishia capsulata CBS 1993]CDK25899.1 unnamed protein product [Kuraishia capsulata CBS 1993]